MDSEKDQAAEPETTVAVEDLEVTDDQDADEIKGGGQPINILIKG